MEQTLQEQKAKLEANYNLFGKKREREAVPDTKLEHYVMVGSFSCSESCKIEFETYDWKTTIKGEFDSKEKGGQISRNDKFWCIACNGFQPWKCLKYVLIYGETSDNALMKTNDIWCSFCTRKNVSIINEKMPSLRATKVVSWRVNILKFGDEKTKELENSTTTTTLTATLTQNQFMVNDTKDKE